MQENIKKYCPNVLFNENNISIGEFKTLEEAMIHPLKGRWCFNRDEDNLFAKFKQQGCRILIVCSWNRQDSQRFVAAIVGHHQVRYWDMNDIPMDTTRNEFEISIGEKAEECIYSILRQQNSASQSQPQQPIQENNKQINTNKNIMKITENQLRRIIKESIENVLSEISFSTANRAGIEAMYRASELEKAGKQKEADRKWQQHRKFDKYADDRYEELKDEKGLNHALQVSRDNWKDAYQKWEPETYNRLYGQQ